MRLTLNALSALRVVRAIRSRSISGSLKRRCDFIAPELVAAKRWSGAEIRAHLSFLGDAASVSTRHPLEVLVPDKGARLQAKGTKSTFRLGDYPPGTFVDVGNGIAIAGPELLFVELAELLGGLVQRDCRQLLGADLKQQGARHFASPPFAATSSR